MQRKVLLIEPNYKNKYPPMGLMKLSTYYKKLGDDVRFFKGDLRDLAATLILEDLLEMLRIIEPEIKWEIYTPNIYRYIRNGKNADIPDSKDFDILCVLEIIREHRTKYQKKEYFKNPRFDIVGITTLFTFEWEITIETINFVKQLCKTQTALTTDQNGIMIGGIASTILPEEIKAETGIEPFTGQLNKSGILDSNNDMIIDDLPLDYSILNEIDYKYPANNAYFAYMTRGCPRGCDFCAVPKLEKWELDKQKQHIHIRKHLEESRKIFGEQRDLLLLDNNVLASACFDNIIDEIKNCGFSVNATYIPPNKYEFAIKNLKSGINDRAYKKVCVSIYHELINKIGNKNTAIRDELYGKIKDNDCYYEYTATREAILELDDFVAPIYKKYLYQTQPRSRYVDFNQGIDARLVTDENMRKLAEINIRPVRIAFDHWSLKEIYEKAVRAAANAGLKHLSNYLLYNYNEKPIELWQRMKFNVELCDELGVAIYSFPMKYHPISDPQYFRNRNYLGAYWNRKYIRAIQAVLNSTHGKIGRGKSFFEEAFGSTPEEFFKILLMPEALIINRFKYKDNITKKWWEDWINLNAEQKKCAEEIIFENHFNEEIINKVKIPEVQEFLKYYKIQRTNNVKNIEI